MTKGAVNYCLSIHVCIWNKILPLYKFRHKIAAVCNTAEKWIIVFPLLGILFYQRTAHGYYDDPFQFVNLFIFHFRFVAMSRIARRASRFELRNSQRKNMHLTTSLRNPWRRKNLLWRMLVCQTVKKIHLQKQKRMRRQGSELCSVFKTKGSICP